MQLVGQQACRGEVCRHNDHSVGLCVEDELCLFAERVVVEALVVAEFYIDVEVAPCLHGTRGTLLNLVPIGLLLVLRQQHVEAILSVVGQCRGVGVGLVIHFGQGFLDLLACIFRYVGALVEHTVHGAHRYASPQGDVFDSYLLRHVCKTKCFF